MPKGSHITEAGYETTYKSIEYATRMKLREVLYDFLRNPISQVKIN